MQTILVTNPKGGVGKSTLATNLAGYFANRKLKVVLCDLDRQQSALRWMAFRDPGLASIEGYFAGSPATFLPPINTDYVVVDSPAGLQGYKLRDTLRSADRVIVPIIPSVFDMAATEDFLGSLRQDLMSDLRKLGIVVMRVDPRTRAASMLEKFLQHFDIPVLGFLRTTQNYVNLATMGRTIFDPPNARNKKDIEQWQDIIHWMETPV